MPLPTMREKELVVPPSVKTLDNVTQDVVNVVTTDVGSAALPFAFSVRDGGTAKKVRKTKTMARFTNKDQAKHIPIDPSITHKHEQFLGDKRKLPPHMIMNDEVDGEGMNSKKTKVDLSIIPDSGMATVEAGVGCPQSRPEP